MHEGWRGWEATGKQRRKRERGKQSESEKQDCNVTVSLNCCAGCLTSLIPPKQTGLTWD